MYSKKGRAHSSSDFVHSSRKMPVYYSSHSVNNNSGIDIDDIVLNPRAGYGNASEVTGDNSIACNDCNWVCSEEMLENANGFLCEMLLPPNFRQGDRSHPNLVRLDHLRNNVLTYPGREKDLKAAESAHKDDDGYHFERMIMKLEEKQRVYDGDRSHPRLQVLDELIWSYPGWQADVADAESIHFEFDDAGFWNRLQKMQKRQQIHYDDKNRAFAVTQQQLKARAEQAKKKPVKRGFWSRLFQRRNSNGKQMSSSSSSSMMMMRNDDLRVLPQSSPENLGSCIVCGLELKSHLFLPCGHLCVCQDCAQETIDRSGECPICRTRTVEAMKVFVP